MHPKKNDHVTHLSKLFQEGKFSQAYEEARQHLDSLPLSIDLLNIYGASAAQIGKLTHAAEAFQSIIYVEPRNFRAIHNLGLVLTSLGKFEEATTAFRTAASIKPNSPEALTNLGNILRDTGYLKEAIQEYKNAIKINPNFFDAFNNLGGALMKLGLHDDADHAFQKALQLEPHNEVALNNYGANLVKLGKTESALQYFEKAISINSHFTGAIINIGNIWHAAGDFHRAVKYYRKAIDADLNSHKAWNNLGGALKDLENLDDAMAAFRKAINLAPEYSVAWRNGAEALEKWNKLDELEIWLKNAKNCLSTQPPDLLLIECKLFLRSKRIKELEILLSKIDPKIISNIQAAEYYFIKAKCYEARKDFQNSYLCFKEMNTTVKNSQAYDHREAKQYIAQQKNQLKTLRISEIRRTHQKYAQRAELNPVFLIGFPRSGTTLLDTLLGCHSKIKILEEKPMVSMVDQFLSDYGCDYLNKELPKDKVIEAKIIYEKELSSHVEFINNHHVYIDKLPLNIFQIPLIHSIFPDSRFILSIRHPLDAIISSWMQNFKLNAAMANMVDLERIVEMYCMAMETLTICQSKYGIKVHAIKYEDLVYDMKSSIIPLLNFINLEWEDALKLHQKVAHQRGRINTPSYSQVVNPIYQDATYRWKNYRLYLEKHSKKVKPWMEYFGYNLGD